MKKAILVILITFIAFSWGFAGGGQAQDDRIPLSFYAWWGGGERDFGDALVAEFERIYPQYRVETFIGIPDYHTLMNTMIAAGSTPDVFQCLEQNVKPWGEAGTIANLDPHFRRIGVDPSELYLETALFRTPNGLWGLGTGTGTIALYYNKDLLRQAGVEPPPADASRPWRWEQFVDAAIRTTRDSAGRTPRDTGFNIDNVIQWGTVMPLDNWIFLPSLMLSVGANYLNEEATALALNNPAAMRVMQSVRELHTVHRAAPSYEAFSTPALSGRPVMLMNGQISMLIDGSWRASMYLNEGFDVGVAPVPTFAADGSAANHTWVAGFVMKAGGSEDAFTLLSWIMNYNNWVTTASNRNIAISGGIPTTRNTYSDPALRRAWEGIIAPQWMTLAGIAAHPNTIAARHVSTRNWDELRSHISPGLERYWIGELTLQAAIADIERNTAGLYRGLW